MLYLPTLQQMPAKREALQQSQAQHGHFWSAAIPGAGAVHQHQMDEHRDLGYNPSSCEQHTQLSELAGGKGKDIPSAIAYFRVLDFFSEGKFRTNETEKVIQIPWQVKTTGTSELFAKRGPYPARAP